MQESGLSTYTAGLLRQRVASLRTRTWYTSHITCFNLQEVQAHLASPEHQPIPWRISQFQGKHTAEGSDAGYGILHAVDWGVRHRPPGAAFIKSGMLPLQVQKVHRHEPNSAQISSALNVTATIISEKTFGKRQERIAGEQGQGRVSCPCPSSHLFQYWVA